MTATETPDHPPAAPPRRTLTAALVIVAALVALAGVGVWWFLRDDSPDEVSLDAAVESVDDDGGEGGTANGETADGDAAADVDAALVGDLSGVWTVDIDTGSFDYQTASGSFVGFRIEEELRTIGATTAVGRTNAIIGSMTIDGTTVTETTIEIDLTAITTETSMRDDNVQDALETDQFPTATFVLTEPIELGDSAASGESVATTATGDLTIHGVTQSVTFAMEAQLVDSTVVAVGSSDVTFADFGVEVPSGGPVLSVDDFGVLEMQLLLTR
ncbi:MAG: YceI family protein [Actinomycetota bacterium]